MEDVVRRFCFQCARKISVEIDFAILYSFIFHLLRSKSASDKFGFIEVNILKRMLENKNYTLLNVGLFSYFYKIGTKIPGFKRREDIFCNYFWQVFLGSKLQINVTSSSVCVIPVIKITQ
jgi:hypothetical protein